ncbi:MAG TPA: DIP1984 family protein [Herpetosiphonaceae bacterium]
MRLAQALILRADYQKRIEQLKQRLLSNAKVQEGDTPSEDPQALLSELGRITDDLLSLIQRINRTNAQTPFEAGQTLADALARRDVLKIQHGIYRDLAAEATTKQDRYTRSEVKFQSTVNVPKIQQQADEFARAFRELDAQIQEANWRTDIIE